jgi:hypothetical protein
MVRILALWFSVGSVRTSNNAELVYALLDVAFQLLET